jgi:hypothetical protein
MEWGRAASVARFYFWKGMCFWAESFLLLSGTVSPKLNNESCYSGYAANVESSHCTADSRLTIGIVAIKPKKPNA